MKRISIIIASICIASMAFGQTRNLKSADRNFKNGKLDKAYESIKLAMEEQENTVLSDAWFSQAKIYTALAATEDPKFKDLADENTIPTALESFEKAFQLDPSGKLMILGQVEVNKLSDAAYQEGSNLFGEQNYDKAAEAFQYSFNARKLVDVIDTNALFNVALCADYGQNYELAKETFLQLIDMKAEFSTIYTSLAIIYRNEGNEEEAAKYADIAAELFSDDYNALINASSIHLMLENYERAQVILADMAEKFSDQKIVFFALGASYMQNGMFEEARGAYLKALELDPDYFEVIFNMAVMYVNEGIDIKKEADELPLSEQKQYDELSVKANESFKQAIPYLEKALELQPGDINVMSTLKDLYVQLGMMEKAQEITDEIEKTQN